MADGSMPAPPGRQLSDADSLMWRIAADPVLRSPILVVGLLDRVPDAAAVTTTFDRASTLLPGLRSRIVAPSAGIGRPRWVPDPGFSPEHHIRRVGATDGDLRSVLALAASDAAAAFDPERPPWTLTIVEGLAGGCAALVLRFHHAITDGMGGLQVAAELFDRRRSGRKASARHRARGKRPPEAPGPAGPPPTERAVTGARSRASGAISTAVSAARDPRGTASGSLRLARSVGRLLGSAPAGSSLLGGRGLDRHLHVFDVPVADLKAAASAAGGTVNDVLLAAVGGAFRSYHERQGVPVATMSVTMPIDRRRPGDDPAGNRFVPARFTLPVDEPDLATRVRIAGAIARSWRTEPALDLTEVLARGLNRLPGPMVTRVFGGMLRTIDVDVVDLQGLTGRAYLGGARLDRLWAFAPPTGAAFSVTLLSHGDAGCVAVACDRAAVQQPDLLTGCIEAGLDDVLTLARPPASAPTQEVAP
jgi:WS/DGAT/MGAT family acyltransferase